MKKLFVLLLFNLFIVAGCEKPPVTRPVPTTTEPVSPTTPLPPLPPPNTTPQVSAGDNMVVFLPVDSAFISGSVTDAENNIDRYRWSQLIGPNQAIIQTPDSLKTKISKLIKGEYSFKLTVTDNGNLNGEATANVLVIDPAGTNTMILEVLDVTCWGPECTIAVDTSNTHIYRNLPIKVFLKSKDSSDWVVIPQQNYFFSSNGKYFWIEWYGLDDRKKWEVMVVY